MLPCAERANLLADPAAPPTSYSAQGAGGNYVWIEPTLDLVVVVRWCGDCIVAMLSLDLRAVRLANPESTCITISVKGLTEKVMAALKTDSKL